MKLIKHIFELNLAPNEVVRSKQILALIMIPIFVLQMSSLNSFFVNVAVAEDGSGSTSGSVSEESDKDEDENKDEEKDDSEENKDEEESKQEEVDESEDDTEDETEDIIQQSDEEGKNSGSENDGDEENENTGDEIGVETEGEEGITGDGTETIIEDSTGTTDGTTAGTTEGTSEDSTATSDLDDQENTENEEEAAVEEEEESRKICLEDGTEIKTASSDDWKVDKKKGTAETKENVKLGVKYEFPLNDNVSVTFTCLPSNEESLSALKIEQIAVDKINLPDGVSAATEFAYDITTEMNNGDFEYNLTLPKSDVEDANINYIEKTAKEVKGQDITTSDLKAVDDKKVKEEKDDVKISELDHFTIFIVTTAGNAPTLSTAMVNGQTAVTVPSDSSVTVKIKVETSSTENDWLSTGYKIGNDSWQCANTKDHTNSGTFTESFTITAPSAAGVYDLTLRAHNLSGCNTSGGYSLDYVLDNAITVKDSNPILTPPILTNDSSDTYALTSVAGIWTDISGGSGHTGEGTSEIRWGSPAGSQKSGLKFTNSGLQSFDEGETFYLGMLTHMNWGTLSGTAANGATLQITLDFNRPDIENTIFTYDFDIEETLNEYGKCKAYQESDTPCDDKITFPNSYGTQTFTIGDTVYTLVIDGFVDDFPDGSPVDDFITEEQQNNSAFLVGHLSSILVENPDIRITKKTNNIDVASAPGPNLNVGDSVEWEYIIQNSGNVDLTNITVTDNKIGSITCPSTTLASGEVITCTAAGTVVEGQYTNTATVNGTPSTGSPVSASDSSYYTGIISAFCGDNQINQDSEQCDGSDLGGLSSSDFSCNSKCNLELINSKIDICHANNSHSNPYIVNQPDKSGDVSGHADHTGPIWYPGINETWGDIIPPFSYIGGTYPGLNWDAEGQAIYNNGCTFPKATLIIQKTTVPAEDPTNFTISTSGTGTVTGGGAGIISDSTDQSYEVTPGIYSVTETVPAGWGLTSNGCLNVTVNSGETKTCTIENKKLPTLTIEKVLVGEIRPLSDFSFVLDGWNTMQFESDGNNQIYGVPNQSYAITETNPGSNYDVTYSAGCNGTLTYNESATCTITNTKYGSLTIVKEADPHGSQSFGFTASGTGLSNFALSDDGTSNSKTFNNLLPGEYSVTENTVSGWDLTGAICSDGSKNTAINISAGEDVICTFSNEMRGAIGGHKYNDADGDIATTGDRTGVAGWTIELWQNGAKIDQTVTAGANGTFGFSNLEPGEYKLKEVLQTGWYPLYPDPSGDDFLTVTLVPGENDFSNDFINVEFASVTVLKNVDTDGDGDIDVTGSRDWTWNIGGSGDYVTGTIISNFKPGTYAFSEDSKDGYHVSSLVCNNGDGGSDNNYGAVASQSIAVSSGQDLVCTFTNIRNTGTLRVVKEVNNNYGGTLEKDDFTFSVDGGVAIPFETDGQNDLTVVSGTYNITEPAVPGYAASYDNCSGVDVPYGGTATCTITNEDIPAHLIVIKHVSTDNGGSNVANEFTMTINGITAEGGNSFPGAESPGTDKIVQPGTYDVTESGPDGYQSTFSDDCTGSIALGQIKTCTVTNDDKAATLIVKKHVINDNGGNAVAGNFSMNVTGTNVSSNSFPGSEDGTSITLDAGTYSVDESVYAGYAKTIGINCSGKIDIGETKTCLITNDDIAPSLTLNKVLVKDNGGNASESDWTLKADGGDVGTLEGAGASGDMDVQSSLNFKAGTYSLTENIGTTSGYNSSPWSCVKNGGLAVEGSTITLGLGDAAVCTITNDDNAPTLRIVKRVVNDNGGNATVGDFEIKLGDTQLTFDSGTTTDNTTTYTSILTTLESNTEYGLSEKDLAGYEEGTWNCENYMTGAPVSHPVILNEGQDVVCTITNDDIAPKLKLSKAVVNDHGGNKTAGNWTLRAQGTELGFSDTGDSANFHDVKAEVTYSLSESGPNGYTNSWWSCDGGQASGNTVLLNVGEQVTCTIINDDIAPKLTIIKDPTNNSGGNAAPDDFKLTIGGTSATSGTPYTLEANKSYVIDEIQQTGYTFVSIAGDKKCPSVLGGTITLDEGDDITCTITNDDIAPTITLNKVVLGGSAGINEFGISVEGSAVSSGSTTAVNANTPIEINETGKDGYTFASIAGGAKCPLALGGTATLDEGENITCTITNTRDTGSITVNKIIDADGNLETTDDQTLGENWQFDVNGTGVDTADVLPLPTDASGAIVFSNLRTGEYSVIETTQPGYDLIGANCGTENGSLDENTVYGVNVFKDTNTICTFYNVPNGTIYGYKWNDLDGSGMPNGDEPMLSGWTINLYKSIGDGEYNPTPIRSMATDSESEHFGWYWFEHLLPGDYKVCEVSQDGWNQTFPPNENCHILSLPDGNSNGFEFSEMQDTDCGPVYSFGNQLIPSKLTIEKFNNRWKNSSGEILSPGDTVEYTIIVTALDNDVRNVDVTDLMPEGFTFDSGSATKGSLSKTYASPGIWSLGDMSAGESVTITYKAKISSSQQSGTYKDLAWADGNDDNQARILASSVVADTRPGGNDDTGVVADNFVGTKVAMATPATSQTVELDEDTETKTETKRKTERVLGASTILPATGSNAWWIILAVAILAAGIGLILAGRKRKGNNISKYNLMKMLVFAFIGTGMMVIGASSPAKAAIAPNIRLEQPTTPTNIKNLNIGFVALDVDGNSMTVNCYKKGPGDASFSVFETVSVQAGGNSGICGIALSADGTYQFKAEVTSDGGSSDSGTPVTVVLNSEVPGVPLDYDRDEHGCAVHFKTADDGLTAKVELFRSTELEFTADSSTFAQEVAIGPNVSGSITDPGSNCDDYYYAIRAVSAAGIGSDFVGDEEVNVKHKTKTKTTTIVENISGTSGAVATTEGNVAGEQTGTSEGQQGEEIQGGSEEGGGQALGEETEKNNTKRNFWIILGAAALALLGYILYKKKTNKAEDEQ